MSATVTTAIATARPEGVTIRGLDLVDDIIGKLNFTEMTYFLCAGRLPGPAEVRVLDACLVTLMEHGWTPSSIIARMMADSVPEDSQVAIAAGLLSLGPNLRRDLGGLRETAPGRLGRARARPLVRPHRG